MIPETIFSDLELSRRLEACEGTTNAKFVEARARLDPVRGAAWMKHAGAFVMFDGAGSPLTQTFGLGLFATPEPEPIEQFFAERGAETFHEVSPLAGVETFELLVQRGYRPVELTSVMFLELRGVAFRGDARRTSDAELWSRLAAEGWSEHPEAAEFMRDVGRVTIASGMSAFIAELDGKPAGTGALAMHDGVALLAGASTIPSARNRGVQRALLAARLNHAIQNGCELAMMCAAPGSASQRNAERQGFRIAYTRVKFAKPVGG